MRFEEENRPLTQKEDEFLFDVFIWQNLKAS